MTVSIRIATSPGEASVAVVDGGRLLDYTLWRPGAPDGVGDIHRGRVVAAVPAMAGAFVAIGGAEGFLPDSEGAKGLNAGAMIAVRVTRAAQGDKGPRLTLRGVEPEAAGAVGLIRRGPDPVALLARRFPGARIAVDDAGVAAALRLGSRVTVASPVFEDEVAEAIEALGRPEVTVVGGGTVSFCPTRALVAIDVDAGGGLAGGGGARTRHEALNRAILPVVGEQIRLRNLSGAIVVDLAGLTVRRRASMGPDFDAALAADPLHPKFLGFTGLGLAEIMRPRIHPPLHELLAGPLAAGLKALRAVMAASGRDPRALPAVRAHPAVVSALRADPVALADLTRRTGRAVTLRSDPGLPAVDWVLERDDGERGG